MSNPIYYIADQNGATSGPFTASEVLKMRTEKEPSPVTDDTFIWQEGTADWQSFSSLKESLEIVSKSVEVVVKQKKPTGVSEALLTFAEMLDQVPRRYKKLLKITDSMESLDKDTAERLISVSDNNKPLSFDAVTEIEPEVASILAQHPGTLMLDGLTELNKDVASALKVGDKTLYLRGLQDISPEVASVLAGHQGPLVLGSFEEISADVAAALSSHKHRLSLPYITSLNEEVAAILAAKTGDLALNGLASAGDDVLQALASHHGMLSLEGISELEDDQARILLNHSGEVMVGEDGLTASSFIRFWEKEDALRLIDITPSDSPIELDDVERLTPDAAEVMARHKGILYISIKSLEPALAVQLAKHRTDSEIDYLALNDLNSLDDQSASELSRHEGYLSLEGLKDFTPAVLTMIGSHRGRVDLCNIEDIPPEILSQLKTNPHVYFRQS
jgi:hypothetical protein